jgi:uncharacterized protein YjbJ (UPF0337 family)
MKESTRDRSRGKAKELKGRVKEKIGRATRNRQLEAEGRTERIRGRVRRKIGEIEKVLED